MSAEVAIARKHSSLNGLALLGRREFIFAAPVLLSLIVLFTSPSFRGQSIDGNDLLSTPAATSVVSASPLGSDFLQEWTGGYIWLSQHRSELYSHEHFKQIQHDPNVVGFSWAESKFYPMVYPPFYYMLASPLALLPYRLAMSLWLVAIGIMLGASVFVWCKYFPPAADHWGKCLIASLVFYPVLMCFSTAHKSVFLLFILIATYLLLHRRRAFLAGAMFGLIAFKPHLAILIGLAMLMKRQWQFVSGACCTVGLLVALSFVAGPDLCSDYFRQCLALGDYSSSTGYQLSESHTLLSALQLTIDKTATPELYYLFCGASVLFVVGMLGWIMRGSIETTSRRFGLQFSSLVIATVLLSPHMYTYDLAILLLPIGLIVFTLEPSAWSRGNRAGRALPMLCIAMFAISGVSSNLATGLHFQLSLAVMAAMLVAIGYNLRSAEIAEDQTAIHPQAV